MAKPRTNEDAALYWGATATERELPDALDVNSITIRNTPVYVGKGSERTQRYWRTEIFSFGWYCMGAIVRERKDDNGTPGRVLRIVTNADQHPSRGFANTPGDQSNVDHAARLLSERTGVSVEKLPITASHIYWGWDPSGDVPYSDHTRNLIRVLPREDDPCPKFEREEVPPFFNSVNPGPEPVDTGVGCVAGRVEHYSYQEDEHIWLSLGDEERLRPQDFIVRTDSERYVLARRAYNGTLVWGSKPYPYNDETAKPYTVNHGHTLRTGVNYIQCPHCKAFADRHETWRRFMHGGYKMGRNRGWTTYSANVHAYGSEDGWREARREFVREQRAYYAELREWISRNYVPHEHIRKDRHGLPRFTSDGYALRVDAEDYFRYQRAQQRAARRAQRECERRERERRQLERWKSSINRRRRKSFITLATEVAQNLASLTSELQSTDNDEPLEGTNA